MAKNIGARRLAEQAAKLELVGRNRSDLTECPAVVAALHVEFTQALKFYGSRWK
jgi:HPt (histidine-containing phosphotransfer) domain-containing protein